MISERHAFTPSRPGGSVCVAIRSAPRGGDDAEASEVCGYPAAHPVHGELQLDLSPRPVPMRTDAANLRAALWGVVEHARQAPPGDPVLAARVDEIARRWGSERPASP